MEFILSYRVVDQTDDFIVVLKPFGVEFHGEEGVLSLLRQEFDELYGVHRLDKETSGLIIFAKNKEAQRYLSQLFKERKVSKTYLAVSMLRPSKKQGIVKGDLEKARNGSYKLLRSEQNPSITRFKSLYDEVEQMRCFVLFPKTGKTHQLRVVMKSLGSPILGDKRYGGHESDRMYLHAYRIEFMFQEEKKVFESYPDNFLFKKLKPAFDQLLEK